MTTSIFTYGSLMFPEIMHLVTGCHLNARAATLYNYARYLVKMTKYPAIIESAGINVEGKLYENINNDALKALDHFEGKLYQRQKLVVHTDLGITNSFAYVIAPQFTGALSYDLWDPTKFLKEDYELFIEETRPLMLYGNKNS